MSVRAGLAFTIAAGLCAILLAPGAVFAANGDLAVVLTQTDGTAPFDATSGAGLDTGANNGVARVNDTVTYKVEVSANNADSTNTKFVMAFPKGEELTAIPAFCIQPGSSLTPTTVGTPTVPLTGTSYQSLNQQTLTCNVGRRTSGSSFSYPVTVRVRSEVPNGATLGPVSAAVSSDQVGTPVSSNALPVQASAKLQWDLSKNGTAVQQNTGSVEGPIATPCPWDVTVSCFRTEYPITMSAAAAGKGAAPAASPITFTDDLSPAALWPGLTAGQLAQITANPAKYGARLGSCQAGQSKYDVPQSKIGGSAPAAQSVRDSGTVTCTQSAPGQPVSVTFKNTDTSLFTFPSTNQTVNGGTGNAIPADRAYAISSAIFVFVPVATVLDFGVSGGGVQALTTKNTFTQLRIVGLDGATETSADQDVTNDYRTLTPQTRVPGTFDKYFVGLPGVVNNTPAAAFSPSNWFQGPPGGSTLHSGGINVSPGQTVVSELVIGGADLSNPTAFSSIGCDAWDNTKLQLTAGDYPGGTTRQTAIGSNGAAAWIGGYNNAPTTTAGTNDWATTSAQLPPHRIQYGTGTGGTGVASQCDSGSWYDTPDAVPGNDTTLAAQGIYTAVSRVRMWVALPVPNGTVGGGGSQPKALGSIALRAAPDATPGELLPNWAGVLQYRTGEGSLDEMLSDTSLKWRTSSYNPADNTGGLGDRLIAAPAYARINKLVKGPNDTAFSSTPPALAGGQNVQYQLSPSLTAAVTVPGISQDVWVEDCLPAGLLFSSANVTPSVVAVGSQPTDAHYTCPNGTDTYLRWDLGPQAPNAAIPPIVLTATASSLAADGTYLNHSQVWAANDFSTPAQRQSSAPAQITNPSGIKIEKVALTPITQVNRAGQATSEGNKWLLSIANVNGPTTLSNPDVIDLLPSQHDPAGTSYHGSFAFTDATVRSGGNNVRLLYTAASAVDQDPAALSNAASGTTTWCSASAGGLPVIGSGACPETPADVTALRVQRPGAFSPGEVVSVEVRAVGIGNAEGDSYVNTAFARVTGQSLPVGPVSRPEAVVGSALGDRVWLDANRNGMQDSGEAGIANYPVTLSGTDDLGNAVSEAISTDADGMYRFTSLRAGTYQLTFDPSGLSVDQRFVQQGVGQDRTTDSDGDAVSGVTAPITVAANSVDVEIDQGVVQAFADVTLHKVVVDPTPSVPGRASTFPVALSCTAPGAANATVTLLQLSKDGAEHTVSGVPVGSTCTATETDSDGARSEVSPSGAFTVGTSGVSVTVTNTYQAKPSSARPSASPSGRPPRPANPTGPISGASGPQSSHDGLAFTGFGAFWIGMAGIAAAFLGTSVSIVAKRRRDQPID